MDKIINESTIQQAEIPLPRLAGRWPLLGHAMPFVQDPVAFLERGRREHGDLFHFKLLGLDMVLFTGLEAHDYYFRRPESELDAREVYHFTVPIFGRGVAYDTPPNIFAEQLMFLFPALTKKHMQRFAKIMYDETSRFAETLDDEGEIDLPHEMNELTVKIASRCLICQEVREQVDSGFAEAYHELQNGINTLGFFWPNLPTPAHIRRDRARRQIVRIFEGIMAERRKAGGDYDDFMSKLMEARYKDGRALTDDEITGILLTVLFAGQHTSAVLATWMGLELFRRPEIITRLRDETREAYVDGGTVNFEGLQNQTLMEYTVREGERLHPPLIILVRKALEDLCYKDRVVPKGTLAVISPAVSHRMPEIFADPDRFNPDRFAPPNSELKQHHYSLIGFGGGKHACMGKNFAIMQLKAIWTILLDHFDFMPPARFPAPNYGSWVTGPVLPCQVKYRRRQKPHIFQ